MLADTWYLFHKYARISIRAPLWSLFNLIQPLIWLIIFGQLFKNFASLPGFPTQNYSDFLIPGVLIMTVLFGSSWSGISLLREINGGIIDKMLVSPVSRSAIVLSRVLHAAVQVVIQTIIILLVTWLMGARLNFQAIDIGLSLLMVFLLGSAFAALSNGLAIHIQREEPLVVIGNLLTLPLMLCSSALVPKDFMPVWINALARINPVDYAVEGIRAVLLGTPQYQSFLIDGLVVGVFAVAVIVWSISAFKSLRD